MTNETHIDFWYDGGTWLSTVVTDMMGKRNKTVHIADIDELYSPEDRTRFSVFESELPLICWQGPEPTIEQVAEALVTS